MTRLKKLLDTHADIKLIPEAGPYRFAPENAREAVLLCHGFTGIPRELAKVGENLAKQGNASYAPRYPGHGTDRRDFLATGAEDWLRRAVDAYLELAAEYETVQIVGHSMGGLIASLVAERFNAAKLVLLAPAFAVYSPLWQATLLSKFTPVIRRNRENKESDPVRQRMFDDYWKDDLIAGAAQLRLLQKAAIRILPSLKSRTLVLTGEKDSVVPGSIQPLIKARCTAVKSIDFAVIPGADHDFPSGFGSDQACQKILAWWNQGSLK